MFLVEPSCPDFALRVNHNPISGHARARAPRRRFYSSSILTLGLLAGAGWWTLPANAAIPRPGNFGLARIHFASAPKNVQRTDFIADAPRFYATSSAATEKTVAKAKPARSPKIQAPRARLMPPNRAFKAAKFPPATQIAPVLPAFPAAKTQLAPASLAPLQVQAQAPAHVAKPVAKPIESRAGGGKMIQFAPQPAKIEAQNQSKTGGEFGGMKKIINVPNLSLPPLSQPLPRWMQAAAVRVDRLEKTAKKPVKTQTNGQRVAQNPSARPVRQPGAPVTNSDRLSNQIEVAASTFVVLLTTTDLQTVAVADPNVADVAVVNSRSVLLNGKTAGVTSLVIVDGQKIRQYSVRVTAAPGLRAIDVAAAINMPGVNVRTLRDALVLEGEVGTEDESKRAEQIAAVYAPKIINQLGVRSSRSVVNPNTTALMELRELIDIPGVMVRMSGENVILTGQVADFSQIRDAESLAKTSGKTVLNLLKLPVMSVEQIRVSLNATDAVVGASAPGQLALQAPLSVRELGGQIVLDGTAASQADLDLALATAARSGLPIVNRVQLRPAQSSNEVLASSVAAAIGIPGIRVSGSAKRLILQGTVADTNVAVAAEQIARAYAAEVDNLLQTPSPLLVDVDVSICEVTDNGLKNLGFQIPSLQDASSSGFVLGQRSINLDLPGPIAGAASALSGNRTLGTQSAFQVALRAELRNENVRLLSNPRTTVLSGRTATFQVGGQVPIPVGITQTATGTTTAIAFKDFGVLVDVVPNATADGNVTLRLRTEVSQPDPSIGFTPFAGSSIIPGFRRRSTVSEITIQPGGTLALGGLISNDNRKLVSKVPILGDLPIFGKLFRSTRFQNNQSELIIFVTPRVLPNPLPKGTTAPAGVVSAGNTTNIGTILGNPGIPTFNSGLTTAGSGGGVAN